MKVYPEKQIEKIDDEPASYNKMRRIAAIIFVFIGVFYWFYKVVI